MTVSLAWGSGLTETVSVECALAGVDVAGDGIGGVGTLVICIGFHDG